MRQIIVGLLVGESNRVIRYRIFNTATGKTQDIDKTEAVRLASTIQIEGLQVYAKYSLIGSNGSLEDYSRIKDDILITENKLVIINEVKYGGNIHGYDVCDCFGNRAIVTEQFMFNYIKDKGIANGITVGNRIEPFAGKYSSISIIKENRYTIEDDINIEVAESRNNKIYKVSHKFGSVTGYKLSEKKNIFWVDYIEVDEKYRKRGIGSQLYKVLEAYICENDIAKTIMLGVSDSISTQLFSKQGFKVLGYTEDCASLPESAILRKQI